MKHVYLQLINKMFLMFHLYKSFYVEQHNVHINHLEDGFLQRDMKQRKYSHTA